MGNKLTFSMLAAITTFLSPLAHVFASNHSEYKVTACGSEFEFVMPFESNKSNFQLGQNVTMAMHQFVGKQTAFGRVVATNLVCQALNGANYTGSEQEWEQYFYNTQGTLKAKSATDLQLTILGSKDELYKGPLNHREYKFKGEFAEGKQVIYNLAIVDTENNVMYTLSVSGSESVEQLVLDEYKRAVKSLRIEH